jgi:hypothetical protein
MRSLNVKKVAAVAAGAAMLGSVLASVYAACPTLEKSFFFNEDGTPNVQIIIGGNSLDGVPAGNLAAVIGNRAYVVMEEAEELEGTGSGTVTLLDSGATGVVSGTGATIDINPGAGETTIYDGNGNSQWTLTKSNAPFLSSGTLTLASVDYGYNEEVRIDPSDDLLFGYVEDDDDAGFYFRNGIDDIIYVVNFAKSVPHQSTVTGTPTMHWLGDEYVVNKWDMDDELKIELIKGQQITVGVQTSEDVTVGDDTYSIYLEDAGIDEGTNIGEAEVTVTCPEGTSPESETVILDTSTDQDATLCGDFLVFLKSVKKSYTPGVYSTATMRVGGDKVTLEPGEDYDDNYEIDFQTTTSGGTTYLSEVRLTLNEDFLLEDTTTSLPGPDGYYSVKYAGTQDVPTQDYTVTCSNKRLNKVTYMDKEGTYNTFLVQSTSTGAWRSHFVEALEGLVQYNLTVWLYPGQDESFVVGDEVVEFVGAYAEPATSGTLSTSTVWVKLNAEGSNSKYYPTSYLDANGAATTTAPAYTAFFDDIEVAGETVDMILGLKGGNESLAWTAVDTNVVNLDQAGGTAGTFDATIDYVVDVNADGTYDDTVQNYLFVDSDDTAVVTDGPVTNGTGKWLDTAYADNALSVFWADLDTIAGSAVTDDKVVFINEEGGGQIGIWCDDSDASNVGMIVYYDTAQNNVLTGDTVIVDLGKSDPKKDDVSHSTAFGSQIWDASSSEVTVNYPDEQLKYTIFAGQEEGETTDEGTTLTVPLDSEWPYEINSRVSITDSDVKVTYPSVGGMDVKPVGTLLYDDDAPITKNAAVVGGHYVNKRSEGFTNDLLVDENSESVCALSDDGSMLYMAGWNIDQTVAVVNEVIQQVKNFA